MTKPAGSVCALPAGFWFVCLLFEFAFEPDLANGASDSSGKSRLREILCRNEGQKMREYLVYFKFFAQYAGAKDPQDAAAG